MSIVFNVKDLSNYAAWQQVIEEVQTWFGLSSNSDDSNGCSVQSKDEYVLDTHPIHGAARWRPCHENAVGQFDDFKWGSYSCSEDAMSQSQSIARSCAVLLSCTTGVECVVKDIRDSYSGMGMYHFYNHQIVCDKEAQLSEPKRAAVCNQVQINSKQIASK